MSISTVWYYGNFNILHPELRQKTREYCIRRSSMWTCWWYPADERISWYGGAIRSDSDRGNGMYMTEPQAKAWKDWVVSPGIQVGPF